VLRLSTENTEANEQALAQLQKERPELDMLATQVAANPQDLGATKSLAEAYLEAGFGVNAFQLFQQVLLRDPGDPQAHVGLAVIWDQWKNHDLALQYAHRALALAPGSLQALEILGRVYLHRDEIDAALMTFRAGLNIAPGNAYFLANAGYAHMLRKEWENARICLERAVTIDGSVQETHNNLGIVLALLGDREEALLQFMAVHDAAAAHNNLGVTYLGVGEYRLAREEFRLALAADPGYEKAAMNLREAESHLPPAAVYSVQPFPAGDSGRKLLIETTALGYQPTTPLSLTDYMRRVFRMQVDAAVSESLALYRPANIAAKPLSQNGDPPPIADFGRFRKISLGGFEAGEELDAVGMSAQLNVAPDHDEIVVPARTATLQVGPAELPGEAKPVRFPAVVFLPPITLPKYENFNGPASVGSGGTGSPNPAATGYSVQVFAAKDEKAARAEIAALEEKSGIAVTVERAEIPDRGVWYRARIRGYETIGSAVAAAKRLAVDGIIKGYWIVPPSF